MKILKICKCALVYLQFIDSYFFVVTLRLTIVLLFEWKLNFKWIWIGLIAGNTTFMLWNIRTIFYIDWKKTCIWKSQKIWEINVVDELKTK